MGKSQAAWLAMLACILAVTAGCAMTEPQSGTDTQAKQERERNNEPSGMRSGGGGGY